MRVDVSRVDVWVATLEDRPGGLAEKLDILAQADVDLEFVSARRTPESPGKGVVFVAPIKGPRQIRAAAKAGFERSKSLHAVRVATGNKPGFTSELTMKIAEAGLNLRGLSAASISNRAIFHLAFDSSEEAGKAIRVLSK